MDTPNCKCPVACAGCAIALWCSEVAVVDSVSSAVGTDGIDYTIQEYDGMERIAEVHRTWS